MVKNRNPTKEKPMTKEEKLKLINEILFTAKLIVAVYPQAGNIHFTRKEKED